MDVLRKNRFLLSLMLFVIFVCPLQTLALGFSWKFEDENQYVTSANAEIADGLARLKANKTLASQTYNPGATDRLAGYVLNDDGSYYIARINQPGSFTRGPLYVEHFDSDGVLQWQFTPSTPGADVADFTILTQNQLLVHENGDVFLAYNAVNETFTESKMYVAFIDALTGDAHWEMLMNNAHVFVFPIYVFQSYQGHVGIVFQDSSTNIRLLEFDIANGYILTDMQQVIVAPSGITLSGNSLVYNGQNGHVFMTAYANDGNTDRLSYVAEFDEEFNLVKEKVHNLFVDSGQEQINHPILTDNGHIVATGFYNNPDNASDQIAYFVEFNRNLDVIKKKTFNPTASWDFFRDIIYNPMDQSFYAQRRNGSSPITMYIVQLDKNFNIIWEQLLAGTNQYRLIARNNNNKFHALIHSGNDFIIRRLSISYPMTVETVLFNETLPYKARTTLFDENVSSVSSGDIQYQISSDGGGIWWYVNNGIWTQETGAGYPLETSSAANIRQFIRQFPGHTSTQQGGELAIQAFMQSDGTQFTGIDTITMLVDPASSIQSLYIPEMPTELKVMAVSETHVEFSFKIRHDQISTNDPTRLQLINTSGEIVADTGISALEYLPDTFAFTVDGFMPGDRISGYSVLSINGSGITVSQAFPDFVMPVYESPPAFLTFVAAKNLYKPDFFSTWRQKFILYEQMQMALVFVSLGILASLAFLLHETTIPYKKRRFYQSHVWNLMFFLFLFSAISFFQFFLITSQPLLANQIEGYTDEITDIQTGDVITFRAIVNNMHQNARHFVQIFASVASHGMEYIPHSLLVNGQLQTDNPADKDHGGYFRSSDYISCWKNLIQANEIFMCQFSARVKEHFSLQEQFMIELESNEGRHVSNPILLKR